MPTPIEEFDAQVEILLAGASHERCLCIDARRRRVCGRRCLNGLRHGGVSKPEAIRRRLWCHQCTSRCVPSAILATNIAQLSDAECFKAARQHHVKAEWIPSVIDSSACLQHPNATTSITGRPIKYQLVGITDNETVREAIASFPAGEVASRASMHPFFAKHRHPVGVVHQLLPTLDIIVLFSNKL